MNINQNSVSFGATYKAFDSVKAANKLSQILSDLKAQHPNIDRIIEEADCDVYTNVARMRQPLALEYEDLFKYEIREKPKSLNDEFLTLKNLKMVKMQCSVCLYLPIYLPKH